MTSVYLIRHAQAQGNVEGRFQGSVDTPLTPEGQKQVRLLAARMRAIPLKAVYASPLRRAWETAEGMAVPHGLKPIPCEGVIEIDGGALENLKFEEMKARYPEAYLNLMERPHLFQGVGGERMEQVFYRMRDSVLELARRHEGGTIAVVSHGAALRCYLCYAQGYPLERMNELRWSANTSVSHITFGRDDMPMVHSVFDDSHLHFGIRPAWPQPRKGENT